MGSADCPLSNTPWLCAIRVQLPFCKADFADFACGNSRGREARELIRHSIRFSVIRSRCPKYLPIFVHARARAYINAIKTLAFSVTPQCRTKGISFDSGAPGFFHFLKDFAMPSAYPPSPKRTLQTGAEEPLQLCASARSIKISFYSSRSVRGFPSPGGAIRSIDRSCPAIAGARGGRTCPRMCLTLASQ
jgi:hypothetical protein